MSHPAIKWSVRIVVATVVLLGLLATSVAIVMNTQWGTNWAITKIADVLPGELYVGEFKGTFWQGLTIQELRYDSPPRRFEARNLEIRVDWPATASGRAALLQLNADLVTIVSPGSDEPQPLSVSMPPLPLTALVANSSIGALELRSGERLTTIRDILIRNARASGTTIAARRVALGYDRLSVSASALAITLAGDVPTKAQVTWRMDDGEWSGAGPVRGSLAALQFEQDIAGPYPANVRGTVALLGRLEPELDIELTWSSWSFGDYEIVAGNLGLAGLIDDYDARYNAQLFVPGNQQLQIDGTASGNLAGLDVFAANVQIDAINAALDGQLEWSPDFRASSRVTAAGVIAERNVQAQGNVALTTQSLQCSQCRFTAGPNSLDINGAFANKSLDFTFALDAPQPGLVLPGYAGDVSGSGSLSGTVDSPSLSFRLRGRDLALVARGDFFVDSNLHGELQRDGEDLVVKILQADVAEERAGTWRLEEPFTARWSASGLSVAAHAWSGDYGQLRVSRLSASESLFGVVARLDSVPIDAANAWLPGNMRLAGTANAEFDLERQADLWSGSFTWQQQDTNLTVTEVNDEVTVIPVPQAELAATLQDGGLIATASLAVEPGVTGTLDLELTRLASDTPMHARLRLQGNEFDWVPALFPFIDQFEGTLQAEVTAQGPATTPDISGTASWRDGRLLVPALNVPLSNIDVVVSGDTAGSASLEGSASAGDGKLAFLGRFEKLMLPDRSLQLTVSGDNAELVNWPEYRLWATPNLKITGDEAGWRFSGDLAVPRAEVALRELPVNAVKLSPDVTVVGSEPEERDATRFTGEALLVLGDEVHFKALGLETRLAGELLVRAPADRPLEATGRVSLVDGTFAAYGQKLTLRDGELTFTGPLDNPIVDVKAVRVIETFEGSVTAGLHLRGRAQELTSTVFAEPAMADADALSYLVIGRPLNEATETEGGDLSGAAVALGLKQAARLTQQIGQSVGLDQLSLTGDGGETTALVAGKQVNSRLYARYAYGVFSRIGALLLRYRLSQNLALEAGVGETQSIDILYSIERD